MMEETGGITVAAMWGVNNLGGDVPETPVSQTGTEDWLFG